MIVKARFNYGSAETSGLRKAFGPGLFKDSGLVTCLKNRKGRQREPTKTENERIWPQELISNFKHFQVFSLPPLTPFMGPWLDRLLLVVPGVRVPVPGKFQRKFLWYEFHSPVIDSKVQKPFIILIIYACFWWESPWIQKINSETPKSSRHGHTVRMFSNVLRSLMECSKGCKVRPDQTSFSKLSTVLKISFYPLHLHWAGDKGLVWWKIKQ